MAPADLLRHERHACGVADSASEIYQSQLLHPGWRVTLKIVVDR